jgi:hypothetical protein
MVGSIRPVLLGTNLLLMNRPRGCVHLTPFGAVNSVVRAGSGTGTSAFDFFRSIPGVVIEQYAMTGCTGNRDVKRTERVLKANCLKDALLVALSRVEGRKIFMASRVRGTAGKEAVTSLATRYRATIHPGEKESVAQTSCDPSPIPLIGGNPASDRLATKI